MSCFCSSIGTSTVDLVLCKHVTLCFTSTWYHFTVVFSHEGGIFLLIWAGHLNFNPDPEFDTFPLHSPGGHSSRKPSSPPRRPLAARAPACSTLTQDLKLMDTAKVRLGENKTGRRRLSRRKKKY